MRVFKRNLKTWLAVTIGLSIVFNMGCATTPLTQALLSGPLSNDLHNTLPIRHEITATPFYPQGRYQCGPASLAAVLNYRGIDISPEKLKDEIYLPKRKGSLQIEITSAVRNHRLLAYPLAPALEDLFYEVAANNPVIVLQNLGISWIPAWHYAIVIGYDLEKRQVILRSGKHKRITTPFKTFENTWQRSQHWGVVIVPPHQLPVTAKALPLLKVAESFEATGKTTTAQEIYKTALTKWPTNQIALMGLGNTYYAQKQYSNAIDLFRRLVETHPKQPSSWNNLAYALSAGGCIKEAIAAAENAVLLSPTDQQYLDSLAEIQASHQRQSQIPCK